MAVAVPEAIISPSVFPYSELVMDICKFRNLSTTEKKQLLCAFEKGSCQGQDILQSWSRKQLKQYLNLQMGSEKKFTCYSKCRLLDRIVKVLLIKSEASPQQHFANNDSIVIRKVRKAKQPTRLAEEMHVVSSHQQGAPEEVTTCYNAACRAKLNADDAFCKRCSCCICWQFDENKDPSLWVVCEGDLISKRGCGLSCHLQCALKLQLAGVKKSGENVQLDGDYCCYSCGEITALLGCWKKQLMIAKDARRVDVLCHRIFLAGQLLKGTMKYQHLHGNVEQAAKELEREIGPLSEGSNNLARAIVSRLSAASYVQRCIEEALVKLKCVLPQPETMQSRENQEDKFEDSFFINFKDVTSTSITVVLNRKDDSVQTIAIGRELWHRRASVLRFGNQPTYALSYDKEQFPIFNLEARTEYVFRLMLFSRDGRVGDLEASYSTEELKDESVSSGSNAVTTKREINLASCRDLEGSAMNLGKSMSCMEIDSSNDKTCDSVRSDLGNVESTTLSMSNRARRLVGSDSAVMRFKQIIKHKKKSTFLGLHKIPCKRSLTQKGCNVGLKLLLKRHRHKVQTRSEKQGIQYHEGTFVNGSQDRAIVDKHPLTNEKNIPKSLATNVLPASCPLSTTATTFSLGSHKNQLNPYWHNKAQINGHSFRVIVRHDAGQSTTLDLMEKPNARMTFDQGFSQSLENLGIACEQAFSPCQYLNEENFEYWVMVIRWLENQGHIEAHFRMRFLSWLGVRATLAEKKVIDTYMKIMIADPGSLAEQLMDTYEEINSSRRKSTPTHAP